MPLSRVLHHVPHHFPSRCHVQPGPGRMQRWHLSVCAWMPLSSAQRCLQNFPKKNLDQLALVDKKHVSSKRWAVKISKPQKICFVDPGFLSLFQTSTSKVFQKKTSACSPFPTPPKKTTKQRVSAICHDFFSENLRPHRCFLRSPSPSVAAGASGPNELPEPKVMAADLGPMGNQDVK